MLSTDTVLTLPCYQTIRYPVMFLANGLFYLVWVVNLYESSDAGYGWTAQARVP